MNHVFVFRIHGSICHYTGSLKPEAGEDPVYAQLYVYDPQEALDLRVKRNSATTRHMMQSIQEEIVRNNEFAKAYKQMHKVLEQEETKYNAVKKTPPEITMCFSSGSQRDNRRSNRPTVGKTPNPHPRNLFTLLYLAFSIFISPLREYIGSGNRTKK